MFPFRTLFHDFSIRFLEHSLNALAERGVAFQSFFKHLSSSRLTSFPLRSLAETGKFVGGIFYWSALAINRFLCITSILCKTFCDYSCST